VIDPAQPSTEELILLKQHYLKSQNHVIRERAHAILLNSQGYSPYQLSGILFRTEKTVREWIKDFQRIRLVSLFPNYLGNENASKLTREQKEEIAKALSKPPSQYGIPRQFWDVSALKAYLTAYFGIIYESPQSYHLIFKVSNFSFKYPAKFDIHRDEKQIMERVKAIRKEIEPLLCDPDWVVLASDESRLTWEALIRRCWLPKGQKSILKVERESLSQSLIGFLNLKSGQPHLYGLPWQNQKEIIKVLKRLKDVYHGKRICLIWDNAAFHKGKDIRASLKTELKPFYLVNFPPYAPEINPQEKVWRWAKEQIANRQFSSLIGLRKYFSSVLMGRNYPYQI